MLDNKSRNFKEECKRLHGKKIIQPGDTKFTNNGDLAIEIQQELSGKKSRLKIRGGGNLTKYEA